MHKIDLAVLASGCMLLSACSGDLREFQPADGFGQAAPIVKAINSSEYAESGSLLLFLEEKDAELVASYADEGTTGIVSLDVALSEVGASGFRRLFPDVPGKTEKAREYGMHRWFEVTFPSDIDVREVAGKFSSVAEVSRIQFNTMMVKASDCVASPYEIRNVGVSAAGGTLPFNDPALKDQWHYINKGDLSIASTVAAGADVNVADAWTLTGGNPEVVVAVLDEGVCYSHPDLLQNMWVNKAEASGSAGRDDDNNGYSDDIYGYNFVTRGPITWDASPDDSGHGTHVAGTVAAVNGNGTGVCGIAGGTGKNDGVKIMSCQIFVGKSTSAAAAAQAFKYAADNGACIAQCSWGYPSGYITSDSEYQRYSSAEYTAMRYFMDTRNCDAIDGGLVIFAAGNEAGKVAGYPGAFRDYICVTSFAPDNLPAYYTNYGPGSNIAAPGGEYNTGGVPNERSCVLSTLPTSISQSGYGYMQGTSMACPHVSGVAALGLSYMLELGKSCTVEEFRNMLFTSVNDIDMLLEGSKMSVTAINLFDYRNKMGVGTVDAWRLLMQIEGVPSITVEAGRRHRLDLDAYLGGGYANLTFLGVEISEKDMQALGFKSKPEIQYGKLVVETTKPGSCKVKIRFVAGGNTLGSGSTMGGMEAYKELSIVSRPFKSGNDGWL